MANEFTATDLDFLELQLLREIIVSDYYEFFVYFWDTITSEDLVANWHIKDICAELQTVGEWVIKRQPKEYDLIINVPPGSSKSSMCTILFPVWLWANDPTIQVITTSFSGSLSAKHSMDSRETIRSDKFQALFGNDFFVRKSEDAKSFYRNNLGGYRLATSTGSMVTGNHGHIIIIDDPIDPRGVKSEAVMNSVNEYVNKTLNSRKIDKRNTPTVMVMQRLHEGDPTGDWLEKMKTGSKKVRHVCLPATTDYDVSPEEYKSKYVNGLLDPVRMDPQVLAEEKTSLGSMDYAGQYGQNPAAVEGNRVKYEWFNYCNVQDIPEGIIWDLWIDGAYTKDENNDPTGLVVMGYHRGYNRLYIRHAHCAHLEMPDVLKLVPEYALNHGMDSRSRIRIEPKATGQTLRQLINADSSYMFSAVDIISHLVSEGKEARLSMASPRIEAGSVWLVKGNWNTDLTYQLCVFPKAKHDEFVDLVGYGCDFYFMKSGKKGVRAK